MREMKDSGVDWIGKIPKSWYLTKIKYCVDLCGSGTTPKSNNIEYYDGDVSWIQSGDLYSTDVIKDTAVKITGIALRDHSALKVYKKDFLVLAMYGASIGNVSISKIDACVNQACCCLKTNANNDLMFLYYWLLYCKENFLIKAVGGTQPNISQVMIKNQCFLVVPYREQLKIVSYLDRECEKLNKITADIEREIEVLQEYKQSVITKAVTKGLDKNVAMKDSGVDCIGEVPSTWEVKRAKYIAETLSKGNGITKEDIVLDGDIQCVRYGEIYTQYNGVFWQAVTRTNIERISSPKYIEKGNILFAGTGELVSEIGKNIVFMGDEPCLAGGDIVVMRHSQNPVFLNYAMNSNYAQDQKSMGKAKLKVVHISATDIGNIRIALPPLNEQEKIAEYLDKYCSTIDVAIADKQKQLDTLAEYKKSLIYEYVTGKKEVPVDA